MWFLFQSSFYIIIGSGGILSELGALLDFYYL